MPRHCDERNGLTQRWYDPLVEPVLATVQAALSELASPGDPWAVPRTGLGGALVVHVARAYGRRRWHRRVGRLAVAAIEAYNQRAHAERDGVDDRNRWLQTDLRWLDMVCKQLASQDGALVSRALERMLGGPRDLGEAPIPESVLFLRAAVAAGVIAGDVDDATHEALDSYVTWLALVCEARDQRLDPTLWSGALAAIQVDDAWPERALQRRSQKHKMTWRRFCRLSERWLPKPRIIHPWPRDRLCVSNPR